jgi:hypothetical protein
MPRTLPLYSLATTMSPLMSVPASTSTVEIGPRPLSTRASSTTPWARPSLVARRSRISVWRASISSSVSMPLPVLAETSQMMVSPPNSSPTRLYSISICLTRPGLASGLSILLMATTIGTLASRACLMASIVVGMMPSSAATTSTTTSVTWAPRVRIAENASWPGVSRNTTSPLAVLTL